MAETATLICPKCRGEMRSYERSGVVVDQCGDCRGIYWTAASLSAYSTQNRSLLTTTTSGRIVHEMAIKTRATASAARAACSSSRSAATRSRGRDSPEPTRP